MNKKELSTENYRGVRDFYPEDMSVQNYIFDVWRKTAESFGYLEYNASPLEYAELYKSKTSEEIVNEQTYTFTDRGDREVTLRPEMTPTLARMIAKKQREIVFPARWYAIPNVFRYEKPQRGRLREHFQLNVDVFGISGNKAEIEMISLANQIMKNFGAIDNQFVIYINDRKIVNDLYDHYDLSKEERVKVSRVIDKKEKISRSVFEKSINDLIASKSQKFLESIAGPQAVIDTLGKENENIKNLISLIDTLLKIGISNLEFNPLLMRGFDYYTGVVFEIFDKSSENNRSLFGGGRFDKLLELFGKENIPAVGFGMGDVTIRDFLETHDLLPKSSSSTKIYLCNAGVPYAELEMIAQEIRAKGINTAIDTTDKKIGDQIKKADKLGIEYVIVVGDDEIHSKEFEIKNLESGESSKATIDEISSIIKN